MPKVAFKNIADTSVTYLVIDEEYLLPAIRVYARLQSDDIYKAIMQEKVSILYNGKVLHPDNWAFFEVKDEDEIIITPALSGDDFGAYLSMIVGVVLIIVGAYSEPIGYPLMLIGASLVLGGISMLTKPTLPTTTTAPEASQTYTWSGIKSIAQADSPVPVVYGTHKVGGNLISLFTEIEGKDSYLYMLLALGEGEIEGICQKADHTQVCLTSDPGGSNYTIPAIELDEQPMDYYTNAYWWYRTGSNTADNRTGIYHPYKDSYYPFSQNIIPKFDSSKVQLTDGRELNTTGIEYTTTKGVDMITVKVKSPSLYTSSGSTVESYSATFKVQWRVNGESTWNDLYGYRWRLIKTPVSNTPNSLCTCTQFKEGELITAAETEVTFKVISNSFVGGLTAQEVDKYYTIRIQILYNGVSIETREIVQSIHRSMYQLDNTDGDQGNASDRWVDISYDQYKSWYWENIEWALQAGYIKYGPVVHAYTTFYIQNYQITLSHDVAVGHSWTLTSEKISDTTTFTISGLSKTPLWKSIELDFNTLSTGQGIYDIKLTRTDAGKSSDLEISNNLILDSVTEIVQGNFMYPNTALLGLKIKATGQLSGSPPSITTIIKGKKISVPSLSGSEDFNDCFWNEDNNRWEYGGAERTWDNSTYETEYSENSILCVRDLVLSDRYGLGAYIDADDLNTSGIITAIKECHKSWNIDSTDLLAWWDRGGSIFDRNISYSRDISINHTTKIISCSGSSFYSFSTKLSSTLEKGREYTISITLSSLSIASCTIEVYASAILSTKQLDTVSSGIDGVNIITVTITSAGTSVLAIQLSSTSTFTVDITDVSVTPTATTTIHNHTYNGVLDSNQAAGIALLEMCESFRCWPIWYSGSYNFIIDVDETPIHTLSVGNTIEFSQSFASLSNIPYRIIGELCDEDHNYSMRSLQTRSTDTTLNKLNELTTGLKGLSNRKKAERELKHKHNRLLNNTHLINVKCGLDLLHGTAGDIINIQDDLPGWGQGGRILDYTSTNITIDKVYTWDNTTASYLIRYQKDDNSFVNATLTASRTDVQIIPVANLTASPKADSVYAIGISTTYIKPFRIVSTERSSINEVSFTALEHTPSLYEEGSVTVIEDNYTTLRNPLGIPGPPMSPSVAQLAPIYGIGFEFNAVAPIDGSEVKEIVVQMTQDLYYGWETVAIIPIDEKTARYVNNSLIIIPPDNVYHFKFFCRSQFKTGPEVEIRNFELDKNFYRLPIVSGIRIKESDVGSTTFDGRDVTISWNITGNSYLSTSLPSFGYQVEVYHTSFLRGNLVRTAFTTSTDYTYTLEYNLEDSGLSTPYSTLIFVIRAIAQGFTNTTYRSITVTNGVPTALSGLTAYPVVGGVKFKWDKATDLDFKNYYYGTKVNSDDWSSWTNYEDNEYLRILTAGEITSDNRSDIYIRVKAKDWYEQLSTVASIVASANTISDNLFQLIGSKSSGATGNVASLYDSRYTTGGVVIT